MGDRSSFGRLSSERRVSISSATSRCRAHRFRSPMPCASSAAMVLRRYSGVRASQPTGSHDPPRRLCQAKAPLRARAGRPHPGHKTPQWAGFCVEPEPPAISHVLHKVELAAGGPVQILALGPGGDLQRQPHATLTRHERHHQPRCLGGGAEAAHGEGELSIPPCTKPCTCVLPSREPDRATHAAGKLAVHLRALELALERINRVLRASGQPSSFTAGLGRDCNRVVCIREADPGWAWNLPSGLPFWAAWPTTQLEHRSPAAFRAGCSHKGASCRTRPSQLGLQLRASRLFVTRSSDPFGWPAWPRTSAG